MDDSGGKMWEDVGRGFWMIHDDSGIILNLLLQYFTYRLVHIFNDIYIFIELYRLILTEWFCSFFLKTTNKPTKWFIVFLKNGNP